MTRFTVTYRNWTEVIHGMASGQGVPLRAIVLAGSVEGGPVKVTFEAPEALGQGGHREP